MTGAPNMAFWAAATGVVHDLRRRARKMKKSRKTDFMLGLGGLLLVLALWALSVQGLLYISYCPELLPNADTSPRNEWQIGSTAGHIELILVPQGYLSHPGWYAGYRSFGPGDLNRKDNPRSRIFGRFSIGQETRQQPFVNVEKYWALRIPYWAVSAMMLVLIFLVYMADQRHSCNPTDT